MSDKQLQRVTTGVAYIGHASVRPALPARRSHTTLRIRTSGIARPRCGTVLPLRSPAISSQKPSMSRLLTVPRYSLLTSTFKVEDKHEKFRVHAVGAFATTHEQQAPNTLTTPLIDRMAIIIAYLMSSQSVALNM